MIHLFVKGQMLQVDAPTIVAGTIDYLSARFCFQSSDWDGLQKWAHFKKDDTVYDIELVNDRIEKDKHLNLTEGEWSIWLHGSEYVDGEMKMRITTAAVRLVVLPTGTTDTDNPFPSATPSAIEQIEAKIGDLSELQTQDKNTLVAAINELFENSGNVSAEDVIAILEKYLEEHPQGGTVQTVNGVSPDEDGNIEIEVGGKQVQPDWSQNDETQPDYVKNRTHWMEPGGMTEILPETSPVYSEEMEGFVLNDALSLEVGAEYTVIWNGTEYICVGQTFSADGLTAVVLGNIGLMTDGTNTGEPFIILTLPPEAAAEMGVGTMMLPVDGSTELTLSITGGKGDVYHKLDNRYLDLDWLPTIDIVENEVVSETTVNVKGFGSAGTSTGIAFDTFTEGMDTVVTWDGAKYNCTVKKADMDGAVLIYIGNESDLSGVDTGEPFVFASLQGSVYIVQGAVEGEHTYSISTLDKVYNTIPEGFLSTDTSDVLKLNLSEMGMETVTTESTVTFSFDTGEALYALQRGKRVEVGFKLEIKLAGATSYAYPVITLNRFNDSSGFGYGSSIERLNFEVERSAFVYILLDTSGITICARKIADLIDERTADHVTNGDTEMILTSSTEGSTKRFKVTVDDSGTLTATEIV